MRAMLSVFIAESQEIKSPGYCPGPKSAQLFILGLLWKHRTSQGDENLKVAWSGDGS